MAVGLQTGVPWVMCKQTDAPDSVVCSLLYILLIHKQTREYNCLMISLYEQINTCNGMRCGESFAGPNSPNKPSMWTENWTSL